MASKGREQRSASGVAFPRLDGRRSTSRTGADVVADSLEGTDPGQAARARAAARWRRQYVEHLAASTRLAVRPEAALAIAEDGLRAVRARMVHAAANGEEQPVDEWASSLTSATSGAAPLGERVVRGSGAPAARLEVPYRGRVLHGEELRAQLETWVAAGTAERGFADAVATVISEPELLAVPGHEVVLLGAGAAMGPLAALTSWGASVTAVDVPDPRVWERIEAVASAGAGTVTAPVVDGEAVPGVDVAAHVEALASWLAERSEQAVRPVLGTYLYADGARHVELSVAADVLAERLLAARPDAALAYLHTPTDTFLVPEDAVAEARQRFASRTWNGAAHAVARRATGGRLFAPAYADTLVDDAGQRWGLADALVDVQGPNYALAKRIQRWRAVTARQQGTLVSSTVAPATNTASVTRNRVLAAVYAGAHRFGVEIFEPETVAPLMAAKLAADLARPRGDGPAGHPERLFADAALHGGLWRQPFQPRTALPVAGLVGAPGTVRRRHDTNRRSAGV